MSMSAINKELTHYSPWMRLVEIISILLFVVLWSNLIFKAWNFESTYKWIFLSSIVLGLVAADAASGLVHWAADTWGSVRWPILGPTLIRGFREHHVDQKAITRHDFIEANGATALIIIPWLILCTYLVPTQPVFFLIWNTFLWLCAWSLMTNQFHKWAHVENLPKYIQIFQKTGLIISVKHHQLHHRGAHTSHYCITTGWLNALTDKLSIFRGLEKVITQVTGARPREDEQRIFKDLKKNSSL